MSQDTVKNFNEVERVEEFKRRLAAALKRILQEQVNSESSDKQRKDDPDAQPA